MTFQGTAAKFRLPWRMPMINVKCPNARCTATYQVSDEFLGRNVVCKKCKTKFKVESNNGALAKNRPATAPTEVATGVENGPANSAARNKGSLNRRLVFLLSGLGVGGVAFCLAATCIVGLGWYFLTDSRGPETYGGIEISSTTVKASVVKFFPDPELGFNYQFLSEDEMQMTTNLKNLGPDGDFDPDSLDKTVTAIATFFEEIKSKHKVPSEKIVIVFGSGVFKPIENNKMFSDEQKKQIIARNKEKLRTRVLAATKRSVEFVTLEEELELQIKSLIPDTKMDQTLLVDLGNSLCRGGAYDTKLKRYTIFNPKTGVDGLLKKAEEEAVFRGYHKGKTPEQRKILGDAAANVANGYFRKALLMEMDKTTEINGRKRIELVGGTPWVTATYKNPSGRAKKHTKLSAQDVNDFYAEVRRTWAYPPFTMPTGVNDKLNRTLKSDVDQMERRMPVEKLIVGTEMLRVLSEELTFHHREVYFNNNGQKALVVGFMTKLWEQRKK
jgi:hypothetical protein